jgi:hypothetical protein
MTIKKNMRSFWYFGGYPKQDFNVIFPFIKSPIDREDLYRIYRQIGKRDVLFLDYTDDGTVFEVLKLDHKQEEQWFTGREEEDDDYEDGEYEGEEGLDEDNTDDFNQE